MSFGEDERTEKYYNYCYACGDGWQTSIIYDVNHKSIKIKGIAKSEERGFKEGDWIICWWCDDLFKKRELLQLIKTKSKEEILKIRYEKQKKYWLRKENKRPIGW